MRSTHDVWATEKLTQHKDGKQEWSARIMESDGNGSSWFSSRLVRVEPLKSGEYFAEVQNMPGKKGFVGVGKTPREAIKAMQRLFIEGKHRGKKGEITPEGAEMLRLFDDAYP